MIDGDIRNIRSIQSETPTALVSPIPFSLRIDNITRFNGFGKDERTAFRKLTSGNYPKYSLHYYYFLIAEHFLHRKFHLKIQIFIEIELFWLNQGCVL